jgi:hypothetical protein
LRTGFAGLAGPVFFKYAKCPSLFLQKIIGQFSHVYILMAAAASALERVCLRRSKRFKIKEAFRKKTEKGQAQRRKGGSLFYLFMGSLLSFY